MLPPLQDYYEGLNLPITIAISLAAVLTATTFAIFYVNVSTLLRNVPKQFKTKTVYLCSIYQVIRIPQRKFRN